MQFGKVHSVSGRLVRSSSVLFTCIVGPALGGILSHPAETMPGIFGDSVLFKRYPYLLPCLVASSFSIFGVFIGFKFLGETLQKDQLAYEPKNIKNSSSAEVLLENEAESTVTLLPEQRSLLEVPQETSNKKSSSLSQVLTREVVLSVLAYAIWAFINVIYDEVLSLFVVTPISLGGLSMTSTEMGFVLSSLGIAQIVGQLFCYPPVERRLGLVKSFRLASVMMIIFSLTLPFINNLARYLSDDHGQLSADGRALVYVVLLMNLTGRTIASCFGYISIIICVNDSCPDIRNIGMVHGFGQVAASFVRLVFVDDQQTNKIRAVGPALGGFIWSWSLISGLPSPLDSHFTFLVIAALSAIAFSQSFGLNHRYS